MTQVLIAGAGIGGITTALCLRHAGYSVTVFEQADALTEIGAGIQLGPNALHVLSSLGLKADLLETAVKPQAIILRHHQTGAPLLSVDLERFKSRYEQDYIHIHRADLQNILFKAAKIQGVAFKLASPVISASQEEDKVCVQTPSGECVGDILIGADGIRSTIRQSVFGNDAPIFSGRVAWRGLFHVNDHNINLSKDTHNWIGPGRHVVAYYVKNGTMINIVAVEDAANWAGDSWSNPGDKDELISSFRGWDKQVAECLEAATGIYKWGLFDRDPLPSWVNGRIALLGDAAHPMLPFMAQGASMAIEDAWVLAHMIKEYDPKDALLKYEKARKTRTSKLQQISRENASLYHAQGLAQIWRNTKLRIGHQSRTLQNLQFDRIYKTNVVREFPI